MTNPVFKYLLWHTPLLAARDRVDGALWSEEKQVVVDREAHVVTRWAGGIVL